jgi:argininosuccinate lyase
MFKRDIGRLFDTYKRLDEMPLGSGALATSTYPIDREFVSSELGFSNITLNSLDSVSDRDYAIETLSSLSLIMMHLSRFSEEIILWCTGEFNFIELDDSYSTGSSIMPQKKNPDVAELVRGKTGRVYGDLITLLTVMKGIPLAYNKDMQEDKEALFDGLDTALLSLQTFNGMIKTMKVKKDNMKKSASGGFTNATDVADYLVKKGVAFRSAHEIVGKIVLYCIDKNMAIDNLSLDEFKSFSPIFNDDIYNSINLFTCVEERSVIGGPSSSSVKIQIEALKNFIYENKENLSCLK